MNLYQAWIQAKDAEVRSIETRRKIEDALVKELVFDVTSEGTSKYEREGFSVRIVGRIDRKVDPDKLQEVAAECGLTNHLPILFRWKPEINMTQWKAADRDVTEPLREAIYAKSGRPSFLIVKKED